MLTPPNTVYTTYTDLKREKKKVKFEVWKNKYEIILVSRMIFDTYFRIFNYFEFTLYMYEY